MLSEDHLFSSRDISVYAMIRNLLIELDLDKDNIESYKWNLFRDIILLSRNVLVKPSPVNYRHVLKAKAIGT